MLIKRNSMEAQANRMSGPKADRATKPKTRKPKFAPITLSEENGVVFLHFGNEWIQGAMRLRKPHAIELQYAQQMMAWMLFKDDPQQIVQLGLGTGALTKFCYKQFSKAQVTAVEINPAVITICRTMFRLPPDDDRLTAIETDAMEFVTDPANYGKIDVIQGDLYDHAVNGPVLDTPEFYAACAACLKPDGIMTVNLFGDHPSYNKNFKALRYAFDDVICLQPCAEGNVVAIAFKTRPELDYPALYERAGRITTFTKLPATSWVNGIKAWRSVA